MTLELPMTVELPASPAVCSTDLLCGIRELQGLELKLELKRAKATMLTNHYTHLLPNGKSHWLAYGPAIVVWSIPANYTIGAYLLGEPCNVWELSRLWAPDGHEKNLLTQAVSAAVKWIAKAEKPDVLVSYADPNAGHRGGIYRAASWTYQGQSEESRNYEAPNGQRVARRAFHSGGNSMTKAQIEAGGFREVRLPGKHRYVKPLTRKARKMLEARLPHNTPS